MPKLISRNSSCNETQPICVVCWTICVDCYTCPLSLHMAHAFPGFFPGLSNFFFLGLLRLRVCLTSTSCLLACVGRPRSSKTARKPWCKREGDHKCQMCTYRNPRSEHCCRSCQTSSAQPPPCCGLCRRQICGVIKPDGVPLVDLKAG